MEQQTEFEAYCLGRQVLVQVRSSTCPFCGRTPLISERYYFSRINGDSGYGYEPVHNECQQRQNDRSLVETALFEMRHGHPKRGWKGLATALERYSEQMLDGAPFTTTVNKVMELLTTLYHLDNPRSHPDFLQVVVFVDDLMGE